MGSQHLVLNVERGVVEGLTLLTWLT